MVAILESTQLLGIVGLVYAMFKHPKKDPKKDPKQEDPSAPSSHMQAVRMGYCGLEILNRVAEVKLDLLQGMAPLSPKAVTYHDQSRYCRFVIGHSLGRMDSSYLLTTFPFG